MAERSWRFKSSFPHQLNSGAHSGHVSPFRVAQPGLPHLLFFSSVFLKLAKPELMRARSPSLANDARSWSTGIILRSSNEEFRLVDKSFRDATVCTPTHSRFFFLERCQVGAKILDASPHGHLIELITSEEGGSPDGHVGRAMSLDGFA